MIATPWHVAVLIPARNEEELLPRCLRSVHRALAALPPPTTFDIVVAVDCSTDSTWDIAQDAMRPSGAVLITDAGVVGHARALAAEAALARHRGPHNRVWLANTDADCIVPESWLIDQLSLAAQGVDAFAGTVDVDTFEEHDPRVEERFRASYLLCPDGTHPHVHGANIGVRADVYSWAGGWRNLQTAEDHDLWNRLGALGATRVSTHRIRVITSGRKIGRAPHGFAGALAAHNGTPA